MKPLENLINVEKARLLHELFPQEIPALLEYTNNMCLTIQEDEQLTRNQWENGLLTVEAWLSFVEEVRSKIDKSMERDCLRKAAYLLTSCLMAIPHCTWCIA